MELLDDLFEGQLSPGKIIRRLLDSSSWTQQDLANITGRSRQTIAGIISGKVGITAEMASALAAAFGNRAIDWLRAEGTYRVSLLEHPTDSVERRARLFRLAPISDMERRGWIKGSPNVDELEAEIKRFYDIDALEQKPTLSLATRRSNQDDSTPAEMAWCVRAKQLASALQVQSFQGDRIDGLCADLRELAAYPKEARHLTRVCGSYGVRFVVVEPLPDAKIDGAAFWLNDSSPAIAVSVRFDRVDSFWHTVMHEVSHIRNGDALSVDTELLDDSRISLKSENDIEARANQEAAASLVPPEEFKSFTRRIGPLYSTQRIVQFAHRIKIHPGIIVGQLQYRGEVGYAAHRDLLVKIRQSVIETALTDGWGRSIGSELL